jgi:hypothetical protein
MGLTKICIDIYWDENGYTLFYNGEIDSSVSRAHREIISNLVKRS